MRIFLSVLGLVCLVFLASFFLARRGPEVDVVVESSSVPVSPYRVGYERGRASFLRQMGEDVPLPPAVKYANLDGHEVSEEEGRGYVDGYHRAAELMYCPRR